MTFKNKILKINRHLFDKGTGILNRVLRSLVPRGSTPRCIWFAKVARPPACHADNEKVKNRAEMLKLKLSLQDKGYRLDNLFKLNLTSLHFGVLLLFNLTTIKTTNNGNIQKTISSKTKHIRFSLP